MRLNKKIILCFLAYTILLIIIIALLHIANMQSPAVIAGSIVLLTILLLFSVLHYSRVFATLLREVIEDVASIVQGKKKRLSMNSPEEIMSLVKQINTLIEMHETVEDHLRQAQEQISKTQRMALLGRLASGVVHEINNPLDGVINCIHTLRSKPLTKKQTRKYLNLVAEGLFRIETITKRLLGLSRDHPLTLVSTHINELVEKALFFIDYRMTQNRISLRCKFTSNLPSVNVDQGALLQVLVNLCLNAIESMPTGGVLSITTSVNSKWLRVAIADTGVGISRDNLSKIFIPFFTTKEEGRGLGLSICLNIIEQHLGEIEAKSIINKGTIFTIKLPLKSK